MAIKLTVFGHQLGRLRICWSELKSLFGEYGHMLFARENGLYITVY